MDQGIQTYPAMNPIFLAEKPRLAIALLSDLKVFENNPTKEALTKFYDKSVVNLARSIVRVTEYAYIQGCNDAYVHQDPVELMRLKRDANSYGLLAAKQITKSTANAYSLEFSASLSKRYAGSKERADIISGDQLKQAFFRGVVKAWGQYKSSAKRWALSGDHDKDDICDENVEQGPIGIQEEFASGDMEPPAHPNCNCHLYLYRQHIRTRS